MLFNHVSTPTVRIWWNLWGAMAASCCNSLMKVMVWYLESDTHNVQLFFMCLFWFGLTWDFGYLHTVFVKFVCNLIDFSLCNHSDSRGGIMMSSFSWDSMYRVLSILQEIRMERSCFWSCSHLHDIWSCWFHLSLVCHLKNQNQGMKGKGRCWISLLLSHFSWCPLGFLLSWIVVLSMNLQTLSPLKTCPIFVSALFALSLDMPNVECRHILTARTRRSRRGCWYSSRMAELFQCHNLSAILQRGHSRCIGTNKGFPFPLQEWFCWEDQPQPWHVSVQSSTHCSMIPV